MVDDLGLGMTLLLGVILFAPGQGTHRFEMTDDQEEPLSGDGEFRRQRLASRRPVMAIMAGEGRIGGGVAAGIERQAGLAAVDIQAEAPRAGLYVWAPVPAGFSSADFASLLLEQTGVSLTPGSAFGAHGEGFMRISLGMDTERIREAMRRIGNRK